MHFTSKSNTMMHAINILFTRINIEIYFKNSSIMDIIIEVIFPLRVYRNHANISKKISNLFFSHNSLTIFSLMIKLIFFLFSLKKFTYIFFKKNIMISLIFLCVGFSYVFFPKKQHP